ncbi:CubicO group peptidase, beta-lactamase class C family [Promicromonospora umidemergens]|uniref:Serine hydrolase domain-containing protein n=1 Tax=Promicromonospora umidemergens TaxID=629679 RepID=A0ABP8XNW8_9MICO|nr:serine hydrolase domain-containing protein [Promicromonospora umidemergens]MCP2281822.1 CubicO group peptidase, beta-lactamase class C family [Promicromonospora umidemergens]
MFTAPPVLMRRLAPLLLLTAATAMCTGPTASASGVGAPTPPTSPAQSTVQESLDRFVAEHGTPGIQAAVLRDGELLALAAAGSDGNGGAMTTATPMRVESLSKSFTALAVLQLVEAGKLDLDEPVVDQLPELTLDDTRATAITLRELLYHTSGMTDPTAPSLYEEHVRTLEDAVERLEPATLATDPGTAAAYHNPNYHVAGRLVEVVSGQPFSQYLDQQVLDPLGMADTSSVPTAGARVPEMAAGHLLAWGRPFAATGPDYFTEGSGGVVSTAADMARWIAMQQSGGTAMDGTRVVTPESVAAMHTPGEHTDDYGFGWYRAESAEGPPVRISHSGAGAGFGAYQGIFVDSGYAVVVLINSGAGLTSPDPGVVAQNLLHDVDPVIPPLTSGADRGRTDWILTGVALVTVGLGVVALARARHWARRRSGRSGVLTVLRMLPWLLPAAVFAGLPALQVWATGRTAPYELLFHVSPVAVVWLGLYAATGIAVVALRAARLYAVGRAPAR